MTDQEGGVSINPTVLEELTEILSPMSKLDTKERIIDFIKELGWKLPDINIQLDLSVFSDLSGLMKDFYEAATADEYAVVAARSWSKLNGMFAAISNIQNQFQKNLQAAPAFSQGSGILDSFANFGIARRLIDYLITQYLECKHRRFHALLAFVGIISQEKIAAPRNPYEPDEGFTFRKFYWARIPLLFSDIGGLTAQAYAWNTDHFDGLNFLQNLCDLLHTFGISAGLYDQNPDTSQALKLAPGQKEVRLPLFQNGQWPSGYMEIGLHVSETAENINHGLAIFPYLQGGGAGTYSLNSEWEISFKLKTGMEGGLAVLILPASGLEIRRGYPPISGTQPVPLTDAELGLGLSRIAMDTTDRTILLLGQPNGTRLTTQKLGVSADAIVHNQGTDLSLEIAMLGAKLIISGSDYDGFLGQILPKDPATVDFDFVIGWSKARGVYFRGQAGLEFTQPLNLTLLDVLTIDSLYLALKVKSDALDGLVALSASARIGPLIASVQGVGVSARMTFPEGGGNFGAMDLALAFKPPSGVGLAIDADMVKGGGFLAINDGNYFGAVSLEIQDRISVNAVGVLITRIEGGEKTFSFKILGCAEFDPVQVGFGFSISGVGLVVAIDCRMDVEALRAAVYGGTLRSLLFPTNIVARAPQIVQDLNRFFPVQEGTYVIGAMVKIGWGGGVPIVKADVGLFFEFGSNLRIALAGIVYAKLPSEQSPVLVLQAQVLGVLDFANKTLAIDASLTGSKILSWNLDGDLALRAAWGDSPRFALSAGGFYPGYKPPAGFPSLRRVSLSIATDTPQISLQGYFAVTENSVQVGATLLFYWSGKYSWPVDFIEIEGSLGFNALFQFNPFYFETDFSATFCLKRNRDPLLSVDLYLFLSGPNNYHAVGRARAEICHIGVSVKFDKRFGATTPEPRQILSTKDILTRELQNGKNWFTSEPTDQPRGTILREDRAVEKMLDPGGALCFRQRSIPLGYSLARIGHAVPQPGECWFDLKPEAGESDELTEFFAPGDFLALSDNQKISGPAFEKMKAGLAIRQGKAVECEGTAATLRTLKYETTIIREVDAEGTDWRMRLRPGNSFTRTDMISRMEARVNKSKYTYGPPLLSPFDGKAPFTVNQQQVAVVTDQYADGFKPASTKDGKDIPQGTFSQARQALEGSGAGGGAHIIDSAKAAKPGTRERPG
jgi:hypothetical protein